MSNISIFGNLAERTQKITSKKISKLLMFLCLLVFAWLAIKS